MGTRFLPATKAVPKELLPIIDTPALQLIIDEAVGAGVDHMVIVTSHAKPAIEAYFAPQPEVIAKLRSSGRDQMADRLESIGRDVKVSFAYQDQALGLGHAVGCARDAVGDEPFAVLLPDELMGSSSLLDQMARLCESTNGSVVGLKEVPHDQVGSYGVIDPIGELDERRRHRHPVDGREAQAGRCAERPDHHRPVRADARRVRRDRPGAAGRRWRDPADRCAEGAGGAQPVPRCRRATCSATTPATRSAG